MLIKFTEKKNNLVNEIDGSAPTGSLLVNCSTRPDEVRHIRYVHTNLGHTTTDRQTESTAITTTVSYIHHQ